MTSATTTTWAGNSSTTPDFLACLVDFSPSEQHSLASVLQAARLNAGTFGLMLALICLAHFSRPM